MIQEHRLQFCEAQIGSERAHQLLMLLRSEWPDFAPFEAIKAGVKLPSPIVAVGSGRVIAGACCTAYPAPDSGQLALWINAVYVGRAHRRVGIGSSLVSHMAVIGRMSGVAELYALTDVPKMYTRNEWRVIKTVQQGSIVKLEFQEG